jgi:hypothetical protein
MATIRYTTYSFNRPTEINEVAFVELKGLLKMNSDLSLNPKSSILENFKLDFIFFGIAIVGGLLASTNIDWLSAIGGFAVIVGFFNLFSFIPSFSSYMSYLSSKETYYRRLKKDIINSDTYNDFKANRIYF